MFLQNILLIAFLFQFDGRGLEGELFEQYSHLKDYYNFNVTYHVLYNFED